MDSEHSLVVYTSYTLGSKLLIFLAVFSFSVKLWSQVLSDEADQQRIALLEIEREAPLIYDSAWYTGRLVTLNYSRGRGTPFFHDEGSLEGTVTWNGVKREGLVLSLDLITGNLILNAARTGGEFITVALTNSMIASFELFAGRDTFHFIVNSSLSTHLEGLPTGYLEIIQACTYNLYLKHSKKQVFEGSNSQPFLYEYSRDIFLYWEDTLVDISKKGDFLSTFAPYKREIGKFMRMNWIKYDEMNSSQLKMLVQFASENTSGVK